MSRKSAEEFLAWIKANDPMPNMSAEEAQAYRDERERMFREAEAPILEGSRTRRPASQDPQAPSRTLSFRRSAPER